MDRRSGAADVSGRSVGTTASFGALPTPLTLGTTTGAALTTAADTGNNGLSLTFAAPTTNTSVWSISCYAPTMQTY